MCGLPSDVRYNGLDIEILQTGPIRGQRIFGLEFFGGEGEAEDGRNPLDSADVSVRIPEHCLRSIPQRMLIFAQVDSMFIPRQGFAATLDLGTIHDRSAFRILIIDCELGFGVYTGLRLVSSGARSDPETRFVHHRPVSRAILQQPNAFSRSTNAESHVGLNTTVFTVGFERQQTRHRGSDIPPSCLIRPNKYFFPGFSQIRFPAHSQYTILTDVKRTYHSINPHPCRGST